MVVVYIKTIKTFFKTKSQVLQNSKLYSIKLIKTNTAPKRSPYYTPVAAFFMWQMSWEMAGSVLFVQVSTTLFVSSTSVQYEISMYWPMGGHNVQHRNIFGLKNHRYNRVQTDFFGSVWMQSVLLGCTVTVDFLCAVFTRRTLLKFHRRNGILPT